MEAQLEVVRIAPTFFAHLATNVMLSWCLFTKISASELSRKFIKSALSVGLEEEEKSVAVIIRGTT